MKSLIKCPFTPNNSLNPLLNYVGTKIRIEFNGSCLKQDKISFNHGKVVNIYIFYEINKNYNISSFLSLENCLFGAVELAKLILISTNILDVVLDLIEKDFFHLVMKLVEIS